MTQTISCTLSWGVSHHILVPRPSSSRLFSTRTVIPALKQPALVFNCSLSLMSIYMMHLGCPIDSTLSLLQLLINLPSHPLPLSLLPQNHFFLLPLLALAHRFSIPLHLIKISLHLFVISFSAVTESRIL